MFDDWLDHMSSDDEDYKARMVKENRCVCCGVKLPYGRASRLPAKLRECPDCLKQNSVHSMETTHTGPGPVSTHQEVTRRMGYSSCQAGSSIDEED